MESISATKTEGTMGNIDNQVRLKLMFKIKLNNHILNNSIYKFTREKTFYSHTLPNKDII